ncbi:MAG: SMP-30/gluconolactonase/LRE family protein [Acidobacteriota bacterium]|nr:SMP-30/gluconolactonase/LRE family protein [Acidobacteriota bacterium]
MKDFQRHSHFVVTVALFFCGLFSVSAQTTPPASDDYPVGRESLPQAGVPAGKTFTFEMKSSRVFPDSVHTITVYIPAEYTGEKPACLYVGLDGLGFHASTVFDNLIAEHAIPITIGVGVSPGIVESGKQPENPRFDRSFEFDSLNDRLARFLLEEVMPEVEKHSTPDGHPILISANGNDRAIGGASTGAIAAFTVAWQRPDAFSRVFSAIGTYVGMRGGESYYVLVRKTEPKPLRIFIQDGLHDEWNGGPEMGDWWMSNQTMERALEFAGYDVRHVWGVGTHNDQQAAMLFPEAMRWLWKDWPAPVATGEFGNPVLKAILQPDEQWQIATANCPGVTHLASNPQGEVFPMECTSADTSAARAFGADGKLFRGDTVAKGLRVKDFTVRGNGNIYATTDGELWLVRPNGNRTRIDTGLKGPSGIAFSPDGLWLFVAQNLSRTGMSYRVQTDGTVDSREPFYDFYVPTWADDSGAGELAMDKDGRAYAATRMGVQVFDRNGRVTAILPLPGNHPVTGICFGGKEFDTLYAASDGKIYKRKLRITGALPWGPAIALPPWGAG